MEKSRTWVTLTALSAVIIAAIVDQFPLSERDGRTNYALATACLSFIFGLFFTMANVIEKIGARVLGNVIENGVAGVTVSLWVIAIAFIQSPKHGIATEVEDGQEQIKYANLYFFSWITFITTIYLFGNVFTDNLAYNEKFSQYVMLLATSVILTATSVATKEGICANDDEAAITCGRVSYAIAVGSIGIVLSSISIGASAFGFFNAFLDIGVSVLAAVLYFFGVVFLTSASGPAKTLGNMYFSVWGGCAVSFALLVSIFLPNNKQSTDTETEMTGNDTTQQPEEQI